MKHVCVTDPGNPSQSLIRRICYPEIHNFSSKATKWGCEHETSARSAYTDIMKDVHSGFVCKESGLAISITYPFIEGLVRMVISSVNVALELGY